MLSPTNTAVTKANAAANKNGKREGKKLRRAEATAKAEERRLERLKAVSEVRRITSQQDRRKKTSVLAHTRLGDWYATKLAALKAKIKSLESVKTKVGPSTRKNRRRRKLKKAAKNRRKKADLEAS